MAFIKTFVVAAALVACSIAAPDSPVHPTPGYGYEEPPQPAVYDFQYGVNDAHYDGPIFSHAENRNNYDTAGEYRVNLPDGRVQIVSYKAGPEGYVADVKYEGEAHYPETAPYKPSPAPYKPSPAPYKPSPAPYKPSPAPYKPSPAPYKPSPAPYKPAPAPYKPSPAPYKPSPAPYKPSPAPYKPSPAPYKPAPAPYKPAPAPYHPAPYHPAPYHPAPYKPAPAPYKPKVYSFKPIVEEEPAKEVAETTTEAESSEE